MSDDDGVRPADDAPAAATPPAALDYATPTAPGAMRWVTVWKGGNTIEANLAVAKLQAAGMHARVDMENSAGLGPFAGRDDR